MRSINVYFEDDDFEKLEKEKRKNQSWREFILEKCINKKNDEGVEHND